LVLTGILLAIVRGLPPVELAPELVQLLVLPPIIYTSALPEINKAQEYKARSEAVEAAIERLDELAAERNLSPDVIEAARSQHWDRLEHLAHGNAGEGAVRKHGELHDEVERLLIAAERTRINDLFRSGKLQDEARRRIERELDLREALLSNQRSQT
jgi:CPA1 family monovalent cation:H+ antiporter